MRQVQRAWREAKRVLSEANTKRLPVDVHALAKRHAVIWEKEMDDGISGMLIPLAQPVRGKYWAIVVNESHAEVRQRFTIAHEFGHLLLHGFTTPHADRGFKVRFRSTRSSDGTIAEEIEANQFAAELLMPRDLLLNRLTGMEMDFTDADDDVLSDIAAEFEVSKQALSIRLSNLLI